MKKIISFITISLFLGGCTTYYIPVESFKKQFSKIDSTQLINLSIQGPLNEGYNYRANPIEIIECVNKNGLPVTIKNSPSIEVRLTYGYRNRRIIFYFDRITVNQNKVYGVESRFFDFIRKSIPLDSITKIEIQDGRKRFSKVY